jgi:hypothetical protein
MLRQYHASEAKNVTKGRRRSPDSRATAWVSPAQRIVIPQNSLLQNVRQCDSVVSLISCRLRRYESITSHEIEDHTHIDQRVCGSGDCCDWAAGLWCPEVRAKGKGHREIYDRKEFGTRSGKSHRRCAHGQTAGCRSVTFAVRENGRATAYPVRSSKKSRSRPSKLSH